MVIYSIKHISERKLFQFEKVDRIIILSTLGKGDRYMNKLILSGRPTRDPEIFYTGEGDNQKIAARFTMASNRIHKREGYPEADFIPIVAFGRQAKFIESYIKKGILIQITGPLQNNDYTNKDGEKVYGFQVVAETVEIFEKKQAAQDEPQVDEEGYADASHMDDMPFSEKDGE